MKYRKDGSRRRSWLRRVVKVFSILIILVFAATFAVWHFYNQNLQPVSSSTQAKTITVNDGATPSSIANLLHKEGLIRNVWTFERYVQSKNVSGDLQAGTYSLSPSQSVADIVGQLTHGKVSTKLVTILPGQRIDQIRQTLINDGFSKSDVDTALLPATYAGNAALVDKPVGNSLEGYLYPDSFQRTSSTSAKTIVEESMAEMQQHLTPEIRAAFAAHGLSTYQGIILASIVEREVSKQSDRQQVAQVFLSRISQSMMLGSDVTALYGSRLNGEVGSLSYDSSYNTLIHTGLPPTPISNVTDSSLQAVAHPANTSWLYFVAGDDGTTYFSTTLQEHDLQTAQYCHKLCS